MLQDILAKSSQGDLLSRAEIYSLLSCSDPDQEELLFKTARALRQQHFADKVFLYGFVYFSTFCKNNCSFCFYRKENHKPPRYRKTADEVLATACDLQESGVHLIDLTTGDDPYYTDQPELLARIVQLVKEATGLSVMVSPGLLDTSALEQVHQAGADWYALYQETHNRALFARLRLEQDYEARMAAKIRAGQLGFLLEEGLLTGVGDSLSDNIDSFAVMRSLEAAQVRTMTFIPQAGTPFYAAPEPDYSSELRNIAVMRLLFPDRLIPASLDVEGLPGLAKRLQAGANVITSLIPPEQGFAGVATSKAGIDEGYRTVAGIQSTLDRCGLKNATAQEYASWVARRKNGPQPARS